MTRQYRIKVSLDVDVLGTSIDDAIANAAEVARWELNLDGSRDWQYHVTHMSAPIQDVRQEVSK